MSKRARVRPKKDRKKVSTKEGPQAPLESFQEKGDVLVHGTGTELEDQEAGTGPEEVGGDGAAQREIERPSSNIHLMERSRPTRAVSSQLKVSKGIIESIRSPERLSFSIVAKDLTSEEVRPFIDNLLAQTREKRSLGIYFHNDMDGLNGALMIRSMVQRKLSDIELCAYPIEYNELDRISLSDEMVYLFIDIETTEDRPNVLRIDHHHHDRDVKTASSSLILLSPPEDDHLYPSTSTGLCAYLEHVCFGGSSSYLWYLAEGPWHDDPMTRALMLLSAVCDNLWHLSLMMDIPIKRWIPDKEEETNLILISISASLLLGSEERRRELVDRFFGAALTLESYMGLLMTQLPGARNVLSFCETVSHEVEGFYSKVFFNMTESIEKLDRDLARDREMLERLYESMPIDMRGNREKMMELLKTKGDPSDRHWKKVEFYGKQLEQLESKINVEQGRLEKLRQSREMFEMDKGPKLCISLPRQISGQVKGIVSSLLYYMGWKNVTLEDRGVESFWGSRGFKEEVIMEQLSTLTLGFDDLKDYLALEKVFRELPNAFKRTMNISRNISLSRSYSGGMGGRGLVFGGVLKGKVPWVFSLLEESGDIEAKIRELMMRKQLGNALQGRSDSRYTVPIVSAIRSKFKAAGWLFVTLVPGKEGADIILGNFESGIMNLAGQTQRIRFNLIRQPRPEVPMDHQRFDIA